jgi:AcrR family transcriptional regulator
MARPKNSPEKIERMRNDMMDAVIDLRDEVPPEKVSIRMIAEKIGVSHMVFYTYFKDRSEIMKALIERQSERIEKHFDGLMERAQHESITRVLEGLLTDYAATAMEHPKIFRMFWMSERALKKGSFNKFEHIEPLFIKLADRLRMGMDKGEFKQRDPRLASVTVLSTINSPIILNICGKMPSDITCDELLGEIKQEVMKYVTS